MKKLVKYPKQYYELILTKQGDLVEKIKTDKLTTYKGEFERMSAVAASSPLYRLTVNLYDEHNQFEKEVY